MNYNRLAVAAILGALAITPANSQSVTPTSFNLSGEWRATTSGGFFEFTQNGNHVSWAAHSAGGNAWQNHFDGDINGNYLTGYFQDDASSGFHNSGYLTFRIEGAQLVRVNPTRAFGDTVLMRSEVYAASGGGNPQSLAASSSPGYANTASAGRTGNSSNMDTEIRNQVLSGPKSDLDNDLEKFVAADSKSWVTNRYVSGSTHNARVLERNGSNLTVYGEYLFNYDRRGSVKVRYTNGKLNCLEFWDFPGTCRSLGNSPSHAIVLAGAALLAVGMMEPSSGSSNNSAASNNRYADKPGYDFASQNAARQAAGGN